MTIALVDYGVGNLRSAQKSLELALRKLNQHHQVLLTNSPDDIRHADRIILPGDGAFPFCRKSLHATSGLEEALTEAVVTKGRPFLGICVGMQLLATTGFEHEQVKGLNWIPGTVLPLHAPAPLKIPHMGWNTLHIQQNHPILTGISLGESGFHAYFIHSFSFHVEQENDLIAVTNYGSPISAIIARDNIIGTQFHPEKSQHLGIQLLINFLKWSPT